MQSFTPYLRVLFCFFIIRASWIHLFILQTVIDDWPRAELVERPSPWAWCKIANPSCYSPTLSRLCPLFSKLNVGIPYWKDKPDSWKPQDPSGVFLPVILATSHLTQVEQQERRPSGLRTPTQQTPKEAPHTVPNIWNNGWMYLNFVTRKETFCIFRTREAFEIWFGLIIRRYGRQCPDHLR